MGNFGCAEWSVIVFLYLKFLAALTIRGTNQFLALVTSVNNVWQNLGLSSRSWRGGGGGGYTDLDNTAPEG